MSTSQAIPAANDPAAPRRRGAGRGAGGSGYQRGAGALSRVGVALGRRSWIGLIPFLLVMAAFLGLPLYSVVHGSLTGQNGQFTLENLKAVVTQKQYLFALRNTLLLSLWTSIVPALLGLWFAAAVITSSRDGLLRRVSDSASYVYVYFAGAPLAFVWIATYGTLGVVTGILKSWFHWDIADHFQLTSILGIGIVYFSFQIPLMFLLIAPALEGLKPEWEEAARNLGASRFNYLRLVVLPVLWPSIVACTLMLFGSAIAAYATALALGGGTLNILPGAIFLSLSNNVVPGSIQQGYALGTEMIVLVLIVIVGYWFAQRRAARWMR
jgi:putative spermidine/putrescine transport system permease protein